MADKMPQDIKNALMDRDFEKKQRRMEDEVSGKSEAPAKSGKARFGTSMNMTVEKQGDHFTTAPTGDYDVERTVNGRTKSMGLQMPSEKAARGYASELQRETRGMKKGGKVSSASSRADGIARKGKTKGRMI